MNEVEVIPNDVELIPAGTARARWAHYDASIRLFVVGMNNGHKFKMAVSMYPGLNRLTDDEIKLFEIVKDGTAIRWERHDLEIKLPYYLLIGLDNEFALYDDGKGSFLSRIQGGLDRNPIIDHEGPNRPAARGGKWRKDRHA
jgi:hypothetical protein